MITVTYNDLNIECKYKEDPVIQQELNAIIAQVKALVLAYITPNEEVLTDNATSDLRKVIIWESEARWVFRNTETALRPPHGNLFFSPEAYFLFSMYL